METIPKYNTRNLGKLKKSVCDLTTTISMIFDYKEFTSFGVVWVPDFDRIRYDCRAN